MRCRLGDVVKLGRRTFRSSGPRARDARASAAERYVMPTKTGQERSAREADPMTEDSRRRFESLETLRAAAYASFNDRRGHEWKLAVSVWTTLALFLAGLAQPAKSGESFPLRGPWVWVLFAVRGLALVILHALWNDCVSRANG